MDVSLRKLDVSHQFVSLSDIKQEISKACAATMSNFGYIWPVNGWKGQQELIDSDEDVKEMYTLYEKKVIFCCGAMLH